MSNHTGEVMKQSTVAQTYGAPPAMIAAKHPSSVMVCKHHHDGKWATAALFDHLCACDAGRGAKVSTL